MKTLIFLFCNRHEKIFNGHFSEGFLEIHDISFPCIIIYNVIFIIFISIALQQQDCFASFVREFHCPKEKILILRPFRRVVFATRHAVLNSEQECRRSRRSKLWFLRSVTSCKPVYIMFV